MSAFTTVCASEFILLDHHPDLSRKPEARPGLIDADCADTPVGGALIERYRGSRDVLLRRLPHRRDGLVNVRGIGRMTWRDVAAVVRDCAESNSLTDLERFAASRTEQWLDSLGIHPTD